jgi:hypothetical protein
MKRVLALAIVLFLVCSSGFAQTGNGSIGGIIQDQSKALLPGVSLSLTNTETGVTTTQVSNETGSYQFQAVPPGKYTLTVSLPSFKQSAANIEVGTSSSVRRDFTMEIGSQTTILDVSVAADQLLIESSPSVGVVLQQQRIADLPIVGQNVLSLLDVLPGFRAAATDSQSTINGLSLDYTNTTINGLSTVSSRDAPSFWGRQVMTTNVINPDLVGEIKLILSPVDAELGRGNSQIQIQTKSGTNKYSGSAAWNVQNTALNANSWANKRNPGPPTQPDWYNLNQITGSYGGPIRKNKTFFFALVDKQMVNRRQLISTTVPTDTARQGILRYWEGWNPGQALQPDPTSFATSVNTANGTIAAIDFNGNPIAPKFNPTGGPYTLGGLRCFSVFGNMKVDAASGALVPVTAQDRACTFGGVVGSWIDPPATSTVSGRWDPLRTTLDSTGYIKQTLALMPHANYFAGGGTDGLNTATYRWLQGRKGPTTGGSTNAIIGVQSGTGDYNNRIQFNIKVDENISDKHRVSVSYTWEKDSGDAAAATWGTGLNAGASRRPQFLTVNSTSTLSSTMVNEGRFGFNYSSEFGSSPWTNLDNATIREEARKFILYGAAERFNKDGANNGAKYPVLYNPGNGWNGFMAFPPAAFDFANYSPLYNVADTFRWSHGKHAFSFGGEYRRPSTIGYNNSAYVMASPGNAGGNATPQFFNTTINTNTDVRLLNALGGVRNNAATLLNTLYGSINAPTTSYWINGQQDIKDGKWQDVTTVKDRFKSEDPYGHQTRLQISNEWSFFAKDDLKLTRDLTLNIGVRWDYAGSPYLADGLTNTIADNGLGLFGAARKPGVDPFTTWLTPGDLYLTGYGPNATNPLACAQGSANPAGIPTSNCDPNLVSKVEFVGPGTDNPDKTLIPQFGQFSPAIGASWQLPWFGEGKTTIRGGFQRTYGRPGTAYSGGLLSGPGAGSSSGADLTALNPIFATRAANLTDLPLAVPSAPSRTRPEDLAYRVGSRSGAVGSFARFAPDYRAPHTDNWTLTVTRSLSRNFTLEIRNVNTLAKDQAGSGGGGTYDINTVNVYNNPELFDALEQTRRGEDALLFDQMLMGVNLANVTGYGAVGTCVTQAATSTDSRLGQAGCAANQIRQRGSAHIRRFTGATGTAAALANGDYETVVNNLLGGGTTPGLQALPIDPATGLTLVTSQRLLRNGCDRLANPAVATVGFNNPTTGAFIGPRCFPENYFIANSQWGAAPYATNLGYNSYNSLEVQITMRPLHGFSMQSTYGFSKTMNQPSSGFTNPLRPELDYGLSNNSVGSEFRTNGTLELPFGPNKLLFGNSSGWAARMMERWQMGFIYNISQGAPRTFAAPQHLYANGRPNIVGPWTNPEGKVRWNGQNGNYFQDQFAAYRDPQCAQVSTLDNLQNSCTLEGFAVVVPQSTPGAVLINAATSTYGLRLLENPNPGQQGTLGKNTMHTFPRWRLDGNLSKTFSVSESISAQLRVDATNIFNHPTPQDPQGLGQGDAFSDNFGLMTTKTGSRTFQARLRFSF